MKPLAKTLAVILSVTAMTGALITTAPTASAVERNYSIFGFNDIRIGNGVNVVITTGKGLRAHAEGGSHEQLDRLSFQQDGKQLVISLNPIDDPDDQREVIGPVTVYLSTFAVDMIAHLGSGTVTLDRLSGRAPEVRLSGFGDLTIGAVNADNLLVSMAGGGRLTMAGKTRDMRLEAQGPTTFDGSKLSTDKLSLSHRGAASSQLTVNREVNITNFGPGKIMIDGRPNCSVQSDGSAEIFCNPKN